MIKNLTSKIIQWRWLVAAATLGAALLAMMGLRGIYFESDYRIYFPEDNPQRMAHEDMQRKFSKNDNILFVLKSEGGDITSGGVLEAVFELTTEAWKLPFSQRVDSLTNFQYTSAQQDDLTVRDLVLDPSILSATDRKNVLEIALAEPMLAGRLLSKDGFTTAVNVTFQAPDDSQAMKAAFTEAAAAARSIVADLVEKYPEITVALSGVVMQNRAMQESSKYDSKNLYPLMYLALLVLVFLFLRSFGGTLITFFVIVVSTVTAIGIWGWFGLPLNTASAIAPAIILTVAVADSIHILTAVLHKMREGLSKNNAIIESLRVNFHPVTLTSLTTIVGYLALNFSEARPIHDLGNITAIGMAAGLIYSVISLPALMAIVPLKVKAQPENTSSFVNTLGGWVLHHRYAVSSITLCCAVLAIFAIPRIELDDQFLEYFDESITFRRDVDFTVENLQGAVGVHFAIGSGEAGGVSETAYLTKLQEFSDWLRSRPEVVHVRSLTDIMKQLNRSMHGDEKTWYRLPEERNLAAQYLLLYEMSLPYGLDLTNMINFDKSSSRVGVMLHKITASEQRQFADAAESWLRNNTPSAMHSVAAGTPIMFAHVSERNIKSMIGGNILILIFITLTITLTLRNIPLGMLSLVVNALPIILTLGIWSLVVGRIGMASAIFTATAFGIIVDDTIHFLSKYERAKREKKVPTKEAILYAYQTVATPMFTTSVMLAVGFGIVATSSFLVNANLGLLTLLAVLFALLCDLFLLPAMLMFISKKSRPETFRTSTG